MNEHDDFLTQIIAISKQAGSQILEWYGDESCRVVHKSDASPLTEADLASDSCIGEALSGTGIPVISEECECSYPLR